MTALKFALAGAALAALVATPLAAEASTATVDMMKAGGKLQVMSSAFKDMAMIPLEYSGYGANESPPLMWSAGPAGTKSYVVLTEDTGASRPTRSITGCSTMCPPMSRSCPRTCRPKPCRPIPRAP